MRIRRAIFEWIGLAVLAGCAAGSPGMLKDASPSIPMTEELPEARAGTAGQQSASLSLTRQGRERLDRGQIDEAIAMLEKAVALQPTNPYAYYYLARARYLQNETGQALALLSKSELYLGDNPPWLSRVYFLRGQVDESLLRPEDARDQYEAALAAEPRNGEARDALLRLKNTAD